MLDRPAIAEPELIDAIRAGYDLPVADLEFLPLGADSGAWTYRATAGSGDGWFVKVRRSVRPAAVRVPQVLASRGFREVEAPLLTAVGDPWLEVGSHVVLVSPFIDASAGHGSGFSERNWEELGVFARRLHASELPPDVAAIMPRETFRPGGVQLARTMQRTIAAAADSGAQRAATDALGARVVEIWREQRPTIERLVRRAAALGRQLRASLSRGVAMPFVPCHADLHLANVLVRPDGGLAIVDWDETMLAPPERDLMFIRGGAVVERVSDASADAFERGYGSARADPVLIAYYRIEWAVHDIADFAEQVLLDPLAGSASRARALDLFVTQFDAGGQVDVAVAADDLIAGGRTATQN